MPMMGPGTGPEDVAVETYGCTDVGRKRRRNEDQFLIAQVNRSLTVRSTSVSPDVQRWLSSSSEGTVLLVADGMGGAGDGDVASAVAVKAIADYLCNAMPSADPAAVAQSRIHQDRTLPGVRMGLAAALEQGDAEVRRAAGGTRGRRKLGTTLTMAYIVYPQMYVAHAGDSRAYLLRRQQLTQLTTDHTYAEKYRGKGNAPPPSSDWHHMLWNALGGAGSAILEPEVRRVPLKPYDLVLLCSDGLTKYLSKEAIAAVLNSEHTLPLACQRLIAMANEAGGSDNTTVVAARCTPPAPPSSAGTPVPAPSGSYPGY